MELTAAAKFPHFPDGDIAVALTASTVYRLHSSVLKRNSTYFAELLHEPAPKLNKQAREENLTAYRIELRKDLDRDDDPGHWVRQAVNERGRFETSSALFAEHPNGKVADTTNRSWEWLFGVFYNKQPDFDDDTLATILSSCVSLVEAAESIHSAGHVHQVVDHALLEQGDNLWVSIAGAPAAWVELACRCQSFAIFKESVCHLVGQWYMLPEKTKASLSEDVRTVCEKKLHELEIAKEAIEMRILGHYPSFLYRSARDKPGRPSYANDIYMWMAIDFFRQFFAQKISSGGTRKAPDGGYQFYKNLAAGGAAYLDHEDFRNFHQYFPMSSKACAVLERDMGVLKEDVKPFVQDLMKSQIHLDLSQHPEVKWLTCTLVSKGDCPWVQREKAEREAAAEVKKSQNEEMFFEETWGPAQGSPRKRKRQRTSSPIDQESPEGSMELSETPPYYGSDEDEDEEEVEED